MTTPLKARRTVSIALIVLLATATAQAGPADLVTTLLRAMNTKDAQLLTSIYAGYFPHRLCNQFEEMLAVAMDPSVKSYWERGVVLAELIRSEATLTSGPQEIKTVSQSGRTLLVFGFHWAFATVNHTDEVDVIVSWEVKEILGEWKVVEQRTSPCH